MKAKEIINSIITENEEQETGPVFTGILYKITSKPTETGRNFFINGKLIAKLETKMDYCFSKNNKSNIRDKYKKLTQTTWNSDTLSEIFEEPIVTRFSYGFYGSKPNELRNYGYDLRSGVTYRPTPATIADDLNKLAERLGKNIRFE